MKKLFKIIISGIIAIVIVYFARFIFFVSIYHYDDDLKFNKEYFWLFKDSIKTEIDTVFFGSSTRKKDAIYYYIYNKYSERFFYNIIIWEFKDLNPIEFKKITINKNIDLDNIKLRRGEIQNSGNNPEINVEYGPFFNNKIIFNVGKYSEIDSCFETTKYKGFYGNVNKISFSNEKGKHLVLINYIDGRTPILFLIYKKNQRFFVIIVKSNKPLNEPLNKDIIKIFNLE